MPSKDGEQIQNRIADFFSVSEVFERKTYAQTKVREHAEKFITVTGQKIKDIYITYLYEDYAFKLQDLWLFSEKYVMVVDDFEQRNSQQNIEESLRLFSIEKNIRQIKVTASNYKFGDETHFDNSILKLECTTSANIPIVLEAWGAYCPRLAAIAKFLVRNLQ